MEYKTLRRISLYCVVFLFLIEYGLGAGCAVVFKNTTTTFSQCLDVNERFKVFWNIEFNDEFIDTLFVAKTDGWASIAWASKRMVPADALVVFRTENGTVHAGDFKMSSKSMFGIKKSNNQGLTKVKLDYSKGRIFARFLRPLNGRYISNISISKENHFIWALGNRLRHEPYFSTHNLHDPFSRGFATVYLDSKNNFAATNQFNSFLVHSVLMILAYLFLVPLGILSLRYFSNFRAHKILNTSGFIIGLVSVIIALQQGTRKISLHSVIGISATFLLVISIIVALSRPEKHSTTHKSWMLAHVSTGKLTIIISWINMIVGCIMYESFENMLLFILLLIGFCILGAAILEVYISRRNLHQEDDVLKEQFIAEYDIRDEEQNDSED